MLAHDGSINDRGLLKTIERTLVGEAPDLMVKFYEHARRDHKAEAEQRKRIKEGSDEVERPFFKKAVYIQKKFKGQPDYNSKPATEQHKREFPAEWEAFKATQGQPPKHSVSQLPGADVCELAIFEELNIEYIEDFLQFSEERPEILEIFTELQPLYDNAKRWRTFMKPRIKLSEVA